MTTANTLAALVNSSSQVVVPSGGIAFKDLDSSNDAATANEAYVLGQDGYEEGTFNPTTDGVTIDDENTLAYTKIGRIVFIQGRINFSDAGSGEFYLENLPFVGGSQTTMAAGAFYNTFNVQFVSLATAAAGTIQSFMQAGATRVRFRDGGGLTSTPSLFAAHVDSGTTMYISGHYFVD